MRTRIYFNEEDVKEFGRRFRRWKQKYLNQAYMEIRARWQNEIMRQQRNGIGELGWKPLDPDYLARKRSLRNRGLINYTSPLRRTGKMFESYLQDITIDPVNSSLTLNYSDNDEIRMRQMVHEGDVNRMPPNLEPRPLNLTKLEDIAEEVIDRMLFGNADKI